MTRATPSWPLCGRSREGQRRGNSGGAPSAFVRAVLHDEGCRSWDWARAEHSLWTVKQSSGHVKVASIVGSGTVVTLYFPKHRRRRRTPSAQPRPCVAAAAKLILLVEDEPALLALGARFLEDLGYSVIRHPVARLRSMVRARAPHRPAAFRYRDARRHEWTTAGKGLDHATDGSCAVHEWLLRRCRRRERRRRRRAGHREAARWRATRDGRANGDALDHARWVCHRGTRARVAAQDREAFAVLRDSTRRPMSNADVFVVPGNRRHEQTRQVVSRSTRSMLDTTSSARAVGYGPPNGASISQIRSRRRADSARLEDHAARHRVFHDARLCGQEVRRIPVPASDGRGHIPRLHRHRYDAGEHQRSCSATLAVSRRTFVRRGTA